MEAARLHFGSTEMCKTAPPRAKSAPQPMPLSSSRSKSSTEARASRSGARLQSRTSAVAPLFGTGALFCSLLLLAPHRAPGAPANSDLFPQQQLVILHVTIGSQEAASLDKDPRTDVSAVVREGSITWTNIMVHLTGSTWRARYLWYNPYLTL